MIRRFRSWMATPTTVPRGLIVTMYAGIVYFLGLTVWVASEVHH